MRESTSWNQANGSTFTNSHDATKLRSTATVLPPRSLPTKVQLRRPTAMPRKPLGVVIIDGQVTIFYVARQRRPVLQRISDRLSGFAPGQNFFANLLQILVQFL